MRSASCRILATFDEPGCRLTDGEETVDRQTVRDKMEPIQIPEQKGKDDSSKISCFITGTSSHIFISQIQWHLTYRKGKSRFGFIMIERNNIWIMFSYQSYCCRYRMSTAGLKRY